MVSSRSAVHSLRRCMAKEEKEEEEEEEEIVVLGGAAEAKVKWIEERIEGELIAGLGRGTRTKQVGGG